MDHRLELFLSLLLLLISRISALKVAVLTDIHLDLDYDPDASHVDQCHKGRAKTSTFALYGRKCCDSPYSLADSAVSQIKVLNSDIVLIPGDIVTHFAQISANTSDSFAASASESNPKVLEEIELVIANFTNLLRSKLQNLPVIFSPGNSDYLYNYQVPNSMIKRHYYAFLYEHWIRNSPAVCCEFGLFVDILINISYNTITILFLRR